MTKTEQKRLWTWRFKVLQRAGEASRNVSHTCRHFGISRQALYKWKRRFDEFGAAGLCDRPRTPHRSPRATARDVVSTIRYLRQHYHFGPGKIADYLKRFHTIAVARSTVHRILQRHGIQRLPGEPEASAAPEALATVREAAAGPPPTARREVPRADSWHAQTVVPVHRH
jgi:transposase